MAYAYKKGETAEDFAIKCPRCGLDTAELLGSFLYHPVTKSMQSDLYFSCDCGLQFGRFDSVTELKNDITAYYQNGWHPHEFGLVVALVEAADLLFINDDNRHLDLGKKARDIDSWRCDLKTAALLEMTIAALDKEAR